MNFLITCIILLFTGHCPACKIDDVITDQFVDGIDRFPKGISTVVDGMETKLGSPTVKRSSTGIGIMQIKIAQIS